MAHEYARCESPTKAQAVVNGVGMDSPGPTWENRIAELNHLLERLGHCLERLQDRLTPVLLPPFPVDSVDPNAPHGESSAIGYAHYGLVNRVRDLQQFVDVLTDRIDL